MSMNGTARTAILVTLGVVVIVGVLGATMAEDNATTIVGFCSMVAVSLLGMLQQISNAEKQDKATKKQDEKLDVVAGKADVAAEKVEEVKVALVEKDAKVVEQLDGIVKMGESNHVLLNSNMGAALRVSAVALRTVADIRKQPADIAAAETAENALREHEARQLVADTKGAAPTAKSIDALTDALNKPPPKVEVSNPVLDVRVVETKKEKP